MLKKKRLLFALLIIILAACAPQTSASPLLGTTAPEFTLNDALGGQTSLGDYAGQPVLLFFHMAVG